MRRTGRPIAPGPGRAVTSRAVNALGVGQLVNWGVLYYAFSALLLPLEQSLATPRWVVAGAFSLALLVSALAAPLVGRLADGGHGPALVLRGGLTASLLLAALAAAPSIATLYVVWTGLGLCMAAALYEPVFTIVGRGVAHPLERLSALARITIFGGLASSVFIPLTAILVSRIGWRAGVCCLAATVVAATLAVERTALREMRTNPVTPPDPPRRDAAGGAAGRAQLLRLAAVFGASGMATGAFTSNIVPALAERGCTPTVAAALAGLFGLMQLPGRILLSRHPSSGRTTPPATLLARGFLIQAAGLVALVSARSIVALAFGVAAFAFGAGLNALVRPHLVQTMFGADRSGYANGVVAGAQQTSRAAGPIVAAGLHAASGYGLMFGLFAGTFALLATAGRSRR